MIKYRKIEKKLEGKDKGEDKRRKEEEKKKRRRWKTERPKVSRRGGTEWEKSGVSAKMGE